MVEGIGDAIASALKWAATIAAVLLVVASVLVWLLVPLAWWAKTLIVLGGIGLLVAGALAALSRVRLYNK